MNRLLSAFCLLIVTVVATATTTRAQAQDDERPSVVVTTTIIADVARNVAGDRANITALMPPNADVHAFNPTPRDLTPLETADLVLINGADLEETMLETVRSISPVEPLAVSNGITVLAYGIDRGSGNLGLTPRRMLLGGSDGQVHVLNVFSDEIIASYPFDTSSVTLHAEQARHARYGFVVTPEFVHVIDSGFRMVAHLDHYDPYLVNPQLTDFALPATEIDTARLVDAAFDLDDGDITLNNGETPVTLRLPDAFDTTTYTIVGEPLPHPNSDDQILVLTTAGELLSVDAIDGTVHQSLAVLASLEVAPIMMTSGDMVYISDPTSNTLLEIYAGTNELVLTDQLAFDVTITAMAAFGTVVDPHALDTTSQVTGRVLGAGVDCAIYGDAVHGPCDAHFWLEPANVMVWADNIATALAEIDPDNASVYRANAAAYQAQLRALDSEIEAILEVVPAENRRLVTNHDFLGYFARRYGFEIVGVVLPGGSTLVEPSSRDLAELVEIIEGEGIQTIIIEASNPNRISDTLAEQIGIETILLYSGALSDVDGPTPTYIDFMRYNARAIAAVLGGGM